MGPSGIIQHPLDRFSLTKSMADLDARGRDAVDQLMTRIGALQFCRHDIRGTCARYFGMFWTVRGANAILALRCCHMNGEFEDYWEERRAA